ncbi:GATA-type domain-containing protein [Forsythia ovata]|uniref:GATA-type domain-containing protein n=1 Tax=Forsythia ovata TaxID=205694 RepID=A0ABD1U505_9LAMI
MLVFDRCSLRIGPGYKSCTVTDDLEWLSHFVEESFSEYSFTEKLPPNPSENWSELEISVLEKPRFITPVQTKARSTIFVESGSLFSLPDLAPCLEATYLAAFLGSMKRDGASSVEKQQKKPFLSTAKHAENPGDMAGSQNGKCYSVDCCLCTS